MTKDEITALVTEMSAKYMEELAESVEKYVLKDDLKGEVQTIVN